MSGDKMRGFSKKYEGDLNIHTDEATAKAAGMPAAVAQGLMSYSFAYELLLSAFGPETAYSDAEVEMAFIRPVLEGDSISAHAEVTDIRRSVDGATLLELSLWCETDRGAQVAAGSAAVRLRS